MTQKVLGEVLKKACLETGFDYAEAWYPTKSAKYGKVLNCFPVWWLSNKYRDEKLELFAKFRKLTETLYFPDNIGLPGRAFHTKKREWVADLQTLAPTAFLRLETAQQLGLHTGCAVPLVMGAGDPIAVICLMSFDMKQETPRVFTNLVKSLEVHLPAVAQFGQEMASQTSDSDILTTGTQSLSDIMTGGYMPGYLPQQAMAGGLLGGEGMPNMFFRPGLGMIPLMTNNGQQQQQTMSRNVQQAPALQAMAELSVMHHQWAQQQPGMFQQGLTTAPPPQQMSAVNSASSSSPPPQQQQQTTSTGATRKRAASARGGSSDSLTSGAQDGKPKSSKRASPQVPTVPTAPLLVNAPVLSVINESTGGVSPTNDSSD